MVLEFSSGLFNSRDPTIFKKRQVYKYWTCSGTNFKAATGFNQANLIYTGGKIVMGGNAIGLEAPITGIPDEARFVSAIVYGNISDEIWDLGQTALTTGIFSAIFAANINSSDDTPWGGAARGIVNTKNNSYTIRTGSLDTGDEVYGALIIYYIVEEGNR